MNPLFERQCTAAHDVARRCEGAFVDRVTCTAVASHSAIDIALVQVPQLGAVVFTLERLWRVHMANLLEREGSFVDDLSVTHLPADAGPWPGDAERLLTRFPGMPDLVRLRLAGPAEVDVIASIITVAVSAPGWPTG